MTQTSSPRPFDNSSFTLGEENAELTIESSEDVIALYGNLNITKDMEGLRKVKDLTDYLREVENELTQLSDKGQLIEKEAIEPAIFKDNPFGDK